MLKSLIGTALGIILALAAIIPANNARTEAEPEIGRVQTELTQVQEEPETLKAAAIAKEAAPEIAEAAETAKVTEVAAAYEAVAPAAGTKYEPAQETAAEETRATPEPTPTVSPQTQEAQSYPKYFFIDGQKYAYLTAYAEEMGYKTFIAPEDEPNATQLDSYDWENDPNGKIPGPFTGNGSN
jgi:hypothetical protein